MQRKSRSSTSSSFIHAVMASTTIVRQPVVWGELWGQSSARGSAQQYKCLVRNFGQAPHPANNHCLTAAAASPTCTHGKSPPKAKQMAWPWWDRRGQGCLRALHTRGEAGNILTCPEWWEVQLQVEGQQTGRRKNGFYCCYQDRPIRLSQWGLMCLCICGLHFIAIQLNKAEKYKGRGFLWKDDTQVHMQKPWFSELETY